MKSSVCPCMISYGSLCEDLVEILLKSPSRGPCMKIFKMLCLVLVLNFLWDAHKKFLNEDLVGSSLSLSIYI